MINLLLGQICQESESRELVGATQFSVNFLDI